MSSAPLTIEQFAEADLKKVLASLTIAEKGSLLAGPDWWTTTAIPRVGVPSIKCSDGPNGVRGSSHFLPTPAQCIPSATALGATFDVDAIKEIGGLLARECRAKGSSFLLGPTCNLQRNPLHGRAFESFSEDPHLSGHITAAYVKGLQEGGVGATTKHFTANDMEDERMSVDCIVPERALREIYMMPFHLAEKYSKPWCLMTSYSRVNGTFAAESKRLLQDVVRDEWGADVAIISDWTGTYSSSEALNAGLDLEMPGPSRWRTPAILGHILTAQKITLKTIDDRAMAVLKLVQRSCKADPSIVRNNREPERIHDTPEDRLLNRKVASESIVLLKNASNTLPLDKSRLKSIAVVGPNAKVRTVSGGGSAFMTSSYIVTPLEGIQTALSNENVEIKYAAGCYAHRYLPMLDGLLKTKSGESGWTGSFYNEPLETRSEALAVHTLLSTRLRINDSKPEGLADLFFVSLEGYYTAEITGPFEFGITLVGRALVYVDEKLIIDNGWTTKQTPGSSFYGLGTREETAIVQVVAGQTYHLRVEYTNTPRPVPADETFSPKQPSLMMAAVRLSGAPKLDDSGSIQEAVDLVASSDAAICVIGTSMDWETEASDRPSLELPGRTDELVRALLAANPNTIIVNQSGSAVAMPWADSATTILQSWFGGNETGNAIADVVFGKLNPSARLSLSFPKKIQDCTAHLNWGAENGKVLYGEGIFVGYRGYLETQREAAFPFGYGLSYTKFYWSDLRVIANDSSALADDLTVKLSVNIQNTGIRPGRDVLQVYVADPICTYRRPVKELKAFAKTQLLAPGESQTVTITLDKLSFSYYNDSQMAWVAEAGSFIISLDRDAGANATVLQAEYELPKTLTWRGL
ncbi:beta-glucosidase [Meredithblackwellia eburnea MCA 4105]